MVLGFHGEPPGPGWRPAFSRLAIAFGDRPAVLVAEDPVDHFRFGRNDLASACHDCAIDG